MADANDSLTKVLVNLAHHWAGFTSESIAARAIGGDQYELRSYPFHAYGLAFGDVVRAAAGGADAGTPPVVLEVVKPSGHLTLRVFFPESTTPEDGARMLDGLGPKTAWQRFDEQLVALDLAPGADLAAVRAILDDLEARELLYYETCEARVPGSFGSPPDEEPAKDIDPGMLS